jgi:hypothetical protein
VSTRHIVLVVELETLGVFDESGERPQPTPIGHSQPPPPA